MQEQARTIDDSKSNSSIQLLISCNRDLLRDRCTAAFELCLFCVVIGGKVWAGFGRG